MRSVSVVEHLVEEEIRREERRHPHLQLEKEHLKKLFAELDSDENGTVSFEELKSSLITYYLRSLS